MDGWHKPYKNILLNIMAEPRKIVLILGNGFDLDLGLKTSYKDFWESEYCPKYYPAPLIQHLNQRWPDNLDAVKWYDLENELYNYYHGITDPENGDDNITEEEKALLKDFTTIRYINGWYYSQMDLLESLVNKHVLKLRENGIRNVIEEHNKDDCLKPPVWRDRKSFSLIKKGLCEYLKKITYPDSCVNTVAYQLLLSMSYSVEAGDSVSIYSFNYTPVLLDGNPLKNIPVYYMHGNCKDNKIIVGTRDELGMSKSYDFLQKSMDESFLPPGIVNALSEADEVIIFGHSLGENDRQYFASFFLRQASFDNSVKKDIIIFTHNQNSQREIKRALQRMTNGNLSALYSVSQPIIIKTGSIISDKNLMFDFLVKHHMAENAVEETIKTLIYFNNLI